MAVTELMSPREVHSAYGIAPQTLANYRWQGMGPAFIKLTPGAAAESATAAAMSRSGSTPRPSPPENANGPHLDGNPGKGLTHSDTTKPPGPLAGEDPEGHEGERCVQQ